MGGCDDRVASAAADADRLRPIVHRDDADATPWRVGAVGLSALGSDELPILRLLAGAPARQSI